MPPPWVKFPSLIMIEWPRPRDINARLSINKRLTRSALATFHAPISLSTVNLPSERTSKQARKRKALALPSLQCATEVCAKRSSFFTQPLPGLACLSAALSTRRGHSCPSPPSVRRASDAPSFPLPPSFLPPPSIIRTVRGRTEGRGSGWSGGRKGEGIRHWHWECGRVEDSLLWLCVLITEWLG